MTIEATFGPGARRPRVLVVDDQPANVQALYQALQADHQVLVATQGEQALQLCRDKSPDLVLLDIVMPGIDGFEVCRRLKAEPGTHDIPVIFVTGHSDEASETRGLDVGAVDFITKPINVAVVRARVRTHLTLKRQSDLLREMAFVDGLTGLHNRRSFDERLATEWQRALRQQQPLALILADIDQFKAYNDHHGHQAGDETLRRVAQQIGALLARPGDMAARYGGEEFACLLPETDAAGALDVARRIEQAVRALAIPHGHSAAAEVVTLSLGTAALVPRGGDEPAALLAAADRQLYEAKRLGRGRAL
ncbi:diguanylate cyclase domain-containing protein [Aquabacterium sp.]|uniref:diguanylate cyclase domain-containing protein n=1 Tax=Aquabacterium sp. TaxID=1872578 RepID=UPI0037851A70